MEPPEYCPFCRSDLIINVNGLTVATVFNEADASEEGSSMDLEEYQCTACEGRSFWV